MTRKKFRHNLMEISRRLYLQRTGSLKGWGEIAKNYRRNWRMLQNISYKSAWNEAFMKSIRETVNM